MSPRTPSEALRALVDGMFARIPALRGADRRLLDMILPTEDLEATTRFVPGAGLLEAPVGRAINGALHLPEDAAPWPVVLRADIYTEDAPEGRVDFVAWQTVNLVGERADREEHVHLYSVLGGPDGGDKLAVSRRRKAIQDPDELPDKARDRYPLTTTRIDDHRADPQVMRFVARSERLRAVIGDAAPPRIELVLTEMDRPFQQPVLREVGGRSHNYYVLNKDSGARMHLHFFDFWRPEGGTRLVDRIGRLLTPHELGHYETFDYRAAARTETWDEALRTGLKGERKGLLPG